MECEMTTHFALMSFSFLVASLVALFCFAVNAKVSEGEFNLLGVLTVTTYFLSWIMGSIWFFGVFLGWG